MLVKDLMRTSIVTLKPTDSLNLAQDLIELGGIRHIPIVQDNTLVGMIAAHDMFKASFKASQKFSTEEEKETFFKSIKIGDVMTQEVISISPDAPISDAVKIFIDEHIGALPVVDQNNVLVGLLTVIDILQTFITNPGGGNR